MSVPELQRGEGKFEVLIKARNLTSYTLQICTNENVFRPQYQNALTNDIIREAKDIFMKCFTANNIMLNAEGIEGRKKLQLEAIDHCNNLLALMQIAQEVFHLSSKRVKYWGNFTIETRNMIRKWIESDRKRI